MKALTTTLMLMLAACGGDTTTTNPAAAYIVSGAPAGACLLEYNSGIMTPTCCYAVGGGNSCNQGIACGSAGGGCCKVYSTSNTTIGKACCFYDAGKSIDVDKQAGCTALLGGR